MTSSILVFTLQFLDEPNTKLHSVTSQKTVNLILTSVQPNVVEEPTCQITQHHTLILTFVQPDITDKPTNQNTQCHNLENWLRC